MATLDVECRMLEYLERLVAFETTSDRSNLDLVEWAATVLSSQKVKNLHIDYDQTGDKANLLAIIGPPNEQGVMLSAHTDVVPANARDWLGDPYRLRSDSAGKLYGRGTADMKGFIACLLAASVKWCELDRRGEIRRPIILALTYDEEVGCFGMPRLLALMKRVIVLPYACIVGEPTSMKIGHSHRGFYSFLSSITGLAAHSGDPSAGKNAIVAAAEVVRALDAQARAFSRLTVNGQHNRTTLNVGTIKGGIAMNIVAPSCEIIWEARPGSDRDMDLIEDWLASKASEKISRKHGCTIVHKLISSVPGLAYSAESIAKAEAIAGQREHLVLPFTTEAGFFQVAGIPTIVCGPGSISQAHKANEWIDRTQLREALGMLSDVTTWASMSPCS